MNQENENNDQENKNKGFVKNLLIVVKIISIPFGINFLVTKLDKVSDNAYNLLITILIFDLICLPLAISFYFKNTVKMFTMRLISTIIVICFWISLIIWTFITLHDNNINDNSGDNDANNVSKYLKSRLIIWMCFGGISMLIITFQIVLVLCDTYCCNKKINNNRVN